MRKVTSNVSVITIRILHPCFYLCFLVVQARKLAKKLIDFADTDVADVIGEMGSDLYRSIDPTFIIESAVCEAMQQAAGYEVAKSQILAALPQPLGVPPKIDQIIRDLELWREKEATTWLSPVLLRECGVLLEAVGYIKEGRTDVTSKMQTPSADVVRDQAGLLGEVHETDEEGHEDRGGRFVRPGGSAVALF